MSIAQIFAYITGSLICAVGLCVFIFPQRRISLIFKASLDCLSVLNGICIYFATGELSIWAGVVTCGLGLIRDIIFYFRNDVKILNHYVWAIGFSVLFALSLIFTYKTPISIIPVVGSVVSTLTLYLNNQKFLKLGALASDILYIAYYAVLLGGSGVLTVFSLTSYCTNAAGALIGLIILIYRDKKKKEEIPAPSSNDESNK